MRWFLAPLVGAFLLPAPVLAHDGYNDWFKPNVRNERGNRYQSCCNNLDCKPRPARFVDGHWQVFFDAAGNNDQGQPRWVKVPDELVETNYDDAWETPDGLAHGCLSIYGQPLCFSPGGGT